MISVICSCCKRSFYLRIFENTSQFDIYEREVTKDKKPFVVIKNSEFNGPRNCHKCQACVEYHVAVQSPINLLIYALDDIEENKREKLLLEFDQSKMIINMWCPLKGKCMKSIQLISDKDSVLSYLVIENTKLVTLKSDGCFSVYDLNDGKCLKTFYGEVEPKGNTQIYFFSKTQVGLQVNNRINIYDIAKGRMEKYLDLEKPFIILLVLKNRNILFRYADSVNQITVLHFDLCYQKMLKGKTVIMIHDIFDSPNNFQELTNSAIAVSASNEKLNNSRIIVFSSDLAQAHKDFFINGVIVGLAYTQNRFLITATSEQKLIVFDLDSGSSSNNSSCGCIISYKADDQQESLSYEIKLYSRDKLVKLNANGLVSVWNLSLPRRLNAFTCTGLQRIEFCSK